MSPPPSNVVSLPPTTVPPSRTAPLLVVALILRVLTFIAILVSVVLISTPEIRYNRLPVYSYMFSCAVIGMVYTFLQVVSTLYHMSTGNQHLGEGLALFNFYGDKALSYVLGTGAAAALGRVVDLQRYKYYGTTSFLAIGFMFSFFSSVISSFSLPKKP